jgi:hypothetical protein
LGGGYHAEVCVKNDGAGGGGALIDSEDMGHGWRGPCNVVVERVSHDGTCFGINIISVLAARIYQSLTYAQGWGHEFLPKAAPNYAVGEGSYVAVIPG